MASVSPSITSGRTRSSCGWATRSRARAAKSRACGSTHFWAGPILWLPDQKTLLVRAVPEGQGAPRRRTAAPRGPAIQQTSGQKGASSTYELRDVLKSPKDEELFDYYAATQLVLVDTQSGRITPLGKPDLYEEAVPSPDGSRLLDNHHPPALLLRDRLPPLSP